MVAPVVPQEMAARQMRRRPRFTGEDYTYGPSEPITVKDLEATGALLAGRSITSSWATGS